MTPGQDGLLMPLMRHLWLIMANWCITINEVNTDVGVLHGSVVNITHEHLSMTKVLTRWVPETSVLKINWRRLPQVMRCLKCMMPIKPSFSPAWLKGIRPGSILRPQLQVGIHANEALDFLNSKRFRMEPSAGKIMASISWHVKGIMLIDYMPHKTMIISHYHAGLILRIVQCHQGSR